MTVDAIESAAAIAWPAVETTVLGSWRLLAGEGFSRRRNSAIPAGPTPTDLDGRLRDVAKWYRERDLPMLYRITPACSPALDAELAGRGFSLEAPTLVMSRPIDVSESVPGVVDTPEATEAWIHAELEALGVDESLVGPWLATVRSVPSPRAFVAPIDGDRLVGAGLGVVVGDFLGVFEIVVRPRERRRGHARRMMEALHRFGAVEGAGQAFLQVLEDDYPAIALHRALGYEVSHRYWYRRDVGSFG
jgi:ribosomal protein S18 acetylase RimI-like enzyme